MSVGKVKALCYAPPRVTCSVETALRGRVGQHHKPKKAVLAEIGSCGANTDTLLRLKGPATFL